MLTSKPGLESHGPSVGLTPRDRTTWGEGHGWSWDAATAGGSASSTSENGHRQRTATRENGCLSQVKLGAGKSSVKHATGKSNENQKRIDQSSRFSHFPVPFRKDAKTDSVLWSSQGGENIGRRARAVHHLTMVIASHFSAVFQIHSCMEVRQYCVTKIQCWNMKDRCLCLHPTGSATAYQLRHGFGVLRFTNNYCTPKSSDQIWWHFSYQKIRWLGSKPNYTRITYISDTYHIYKYITFISHTSHIHPTYISHTNHLHIT